VTVGSSSNGRIRVFVVDDHALARAGVRAEIAADVDIVGEAASVREAIDGIIAARPDVVLLDVRLPDGGGRAVLDGVLPRWPGARFLALSISDLASDVIDVVRGGARGYVTKAITGAELVEAIHRIHAGDAYFSPSLAGFVLDAFRGNSPVPIDPELDQLTRRERDVLRLIGAGYTYRECAERLHISARTVETHVSAVLRKLQLSNRRELSRWASAHNLV
jgi:DNA-binding NarL/FixJ family response regulator